MDLSILTISYRSPEDTLRCFQSLVAGGADGLEWEFLLGDNGSGDCQALTEIAAHPRVRMLPGSENIGFGRENNRIASEARGEFLLCLNPDTVVPPGALLALVEHLRNTPDCGACGPRLLNPDGSQQFSWNRNMGLTWELAESLYLQNWWRRKLERKFSLSNPLGPWPVDFTSGAALCIRKSVWAMLNGFDPKFFMNHEDIELCHRIRVAGLDVHVLPSTSIVHLDGGTQRKDWTGFVRNRLDAKWIYLGKVFHGPSQLVARGIWLAGTGLRLVASIVKPGAESRQRQRGYWQALMNRIRS